ncbi:MAG TPA: hypothetical protein PKH10_11660, partial [bacterium]|nr:hypothetical protein [bacterium]
MTSFIRWLSSRKAIIGFAILLFVTFLSSEWFLLSEAQRTADSAVNHLETTLSAKGDPRAVEQARDFAETYRTDG